MIGKLLGNRYEILEKIGTGGMGDVYKAHCHKLDRIVAIKILKSQYNDDNNFIRKFRRESLAAASISHPNIVSIYDVGSEEMDGEKVHYIVMEFIDGKTLKELIVDEGKIQEKRALNYLAQITEALKVAHSKGIVHRDIKSQNIMVTRDFRIKVTDFGIARVADNATVTATNAIMGSVHYFSPEQARGAKVDNRSDIYSLGIVFFEMLTGKVPFDADNPVSVALMQVQGNMPKPSTLIKDITEDTDNIVLKMTQKDPDDRYSDVSELMKDIKNIQLGKTGSFGYYDSSKTEAVSGVAYASGKDYGKKVVRRQPDNFNREPKKQEPRGSNRKEKSALPIVLGILCAILLIGLITFVVPRALKSTEQKEELILVPQLIGKTDEIAKAEIESLGLTLNVVPVEDNGENEGLKDREIISQDPKAGIEVEKGSTINVEINVNPNTVKVPDLSENTLEQAESVLEQSGLSIGGIVNVSSDTIKEGLIVKQDPASGTQVEAGSKVTLYFSSGEEEVKDKPVPNVSGLTLKDAEETIRKAGFEVKITEIKSSKVDFGEVADYNPKGETAPGTVVELFVSNGPEESGNLIEEETNPNEEEPSSANEEDNSRSNSSTKPSEINVDVPNDGKSHSLTINRYTKNGKSYKLADFKNLTEDYSIKLEYANSGDRFEVILDGKTIDEFVLE